MSCSLPNGYKFVKTRVDWQLLSDVTDNQYEVVGSRKWIDSKGVLPDGYTLTLKILVDNYNYGLDKDGEPIDNNVGQNFDVTILSRDVKPKKGDIVALLNYDEDNSYVIKYDWLLRFKGVKVLRAASANTSASISTNTNAKPNA
jgi:hypothetical protein